MSQEISQGNKLIAEFLGMFYDKLGAYMKVWIHGDEPTFFHCEWHPEYDVKDNKFIAWEFAPDKNWCQLMPVVEKIEEMGYQTLLKKHINRRKTDHEMLYYDKENGDCIIEADFTYKSKIDCVYQATISFIQWYNSQTPKEVNK